MATFGPGDRAPGWQPPTSPPAKVYSSDELEKIIDEFTSESTPVTSHKASTADEGQKAEPGQDQLRCPYHKEGCKYQHVTHAAKCPVHGISLV